MKKKILTLSICFILLSCLSNDDLELSDEMLSYINKIEKIHMYSIERHLFFSSRERWQLYPEEHIREYGDLFIFSNIRLHSRQAFFIALLLYNAEPVDIDPKKNIIKTVKEHGNEWFVDSGCVIDIYYRNEEKKTYIMQNGLDVFYEKGKEGVYYKMPDLILNSFYINEQTFISTYKKYMRK